MKNVFTQYMYHIDKLRIESNITIGNFCEDICDRRQYPRYMNGIQTITQTRLNKFCIKLGLSQMEFLYSFNSSESSELLSIVELYSSLQSNDFDKSLLLIKKYDTHKFLSIQSQNIYEYCKIEYNEKKKLINKYLAIEQYANLINYPECLVKIRFNFVEMICLNNIAKIECTLDKVTAIDFLSDLLLKDDFIYLSSDTRHVLPTIYACVSRLKGMKDDFQVALEVALKGINYSLKIRSMFQLEYLYYYCAFSYHKLGNKRLSKYYAQKSLFTILSQDKDVLFEKFHRMIIKDFSFDPLKGLKVIKIEKN